MAKSKAVKQAEALERKRKLYPQKLDLSARSRFGGDLYDAVLVRSGKEAADENNKHAQLLFSKYLHEAMLNADGTPRIHVKKADADKVKAPSGGNVFFGKPHFYEPGVNPAMDKFIANQSSKAVCNAVSDIMKLDSLGNGKAPDLGISIEQYVAGE